MSHERQTLFWLAGLAIFSLLLGLLSPILLPFVAGMAIAYFLDPVADHLEEKGISRGWGTALILFAFFIAAAAILMLLLPLLQGQVVELAALIPGFVEWLRSQVEPYLERLQADLPPDAFDKIRNVAGAFASDVAKWLTSVIGSIWSGGIAIFNLLSLVVITPVVAFYLLRDWDMITARIGSWLPRPAAPTIREQLTAVDRTIAGFVRGQASVCLVLALLYGAGLSLIGLKSGLLVGLGAGLISFIPYLGAGFGLVVGLGIAVFQFSEWQPIALVTAVFLTGQSLESYVLTPRLVGDRVGLHPVWIIFSLLAGGALFGFTGVLMAVPVAAVIGVLIRFALSRYLKSPLYLGGEGDST